MQDTWLCAKAEDIQSYADSNNNKCFYSASTTLSNVTSSGGTTLPTEKDKILARWTEHFSAVLNQV